MTANHELDNILLNIIRDTYSEWRRNRPAREPQLSTTYLIYELAENRRIADVRFATPKKRRALVDRALARLERRGLVTYSTGTGERGGEVKLWEPT